MCLSIQRPTESCRPTPHVRPLNGVDWCLSSVFPPAFSRGYPCSTRGAGQSIQIPRFVSHPSLARTHPWPHPLLKRSQEQWKLLKRCPGPAQAPQCRSQRDHGLSPQSPARHLHRQSGLWDSPGAHPGLPVSQKADSNPHGDRADYADARTTQAFGLLRLDPGVTAQPGQVGRIEVQKENGPVAGTDGNQSRDKNDPGGADLSAGRTIRAAESSPPGDRPRRRSRGRPERRFRRSRPPSDWCTGAPRPRGCPRPRPA